MERISRASLKHMRKFFKKLRMRWHMKWMAEDNRPLLERLNDYDENGIPYWEKNIPQYPPRAEWCKGEHTWHCENDDHFYDCFCTTCDYWKEWLLK